MKEIALVVDDEQDVVDLVRINLQRHGLDVISAQDGAAALKMAMDHKPDVVILDLMLPEMNGFDVCRELKSVPETASIPVIMLTARTQTNDRINGFETGADDYVTKPFSPKELALRVRALLRRIGRKAPPQQATISDGVHLNPTSLEAHIDGKRLELTATEFKLLHILVDRIGKVQSRQSLLKDVWGYQTSIDTRTVDTHMRRLREKLGTHSNRLQTVWGEGYRFRQQTTPAR
jgi:two-component system phosphate regulon response regulator PhoB